MSCPICNDRRSWPIPSAHDPDAARLLAEAGTPAGYEWRLCRRCGNAHPSAPPDIQVLERLWTLKRGDEQLTQAIEARDAAFRRLRVATELDGTRRVIARAEWIARLQTFVASLDEEDDRIAAARARLVDALARR